MLFGVLLDAIASRVSKFGCSNFDEKSSLLPRFNGIATRVSNFGCSNFDEESMILACLFTQLPPAYRNFHIMSRRNFIELAMRCFGIAIGVSNVYAQRSAPCTLENVY